MHRFYVAARAHFGYAPRWWPGTPVELTVTAILVQQCDWSVAWQATKRLRQAGLLRLGPLAEAEAVTVRPLIHPVAFANQKAARLIHIAGRLLGGGYPTIEALLQSGPSQQVRQDLLALPGIGDETADSILLFASARHETFVVDAYARRLFQRLALWDAGDEGFWRRPYEHLRQFLRDHIVGFLSLYEGLELASGVPRSVALLRDFHAQIVELGRHHCRKEHPRCAQRGWPGWRDDAGDFVFCEQHCSYNGCARCPLSDVCVTGSGARPG